MTILITIFDRRFPLQSHVSYPFYNTENILHPPIMSLTLQLSSLLTRDTRVLFVRRKMSALGEEKGDNLFIYVCNSKIKNGNYDEASVYLAPSKTGK